MIHIRKNIGKIGGKKVAKEGAEIIIADLGGC